MQYSLTSTEDSAAAQRCWFVPEGQQEQTTRDNQPKGSYNLPSKNSLATYLRKSKAMEHNSCSAGQNMVLSSLWFSQKPAT
jgi:hypothetical protein